jgi:N utilization substance protein B
VKSKNDPRHQKRIKLIQALYAWGITHQNNDQELIPVISQIKKIDKLISKAAPKWPLDQINKVELAILRYSVWELKNHPDTPAKVIIDEAIEIGKEFGDTKSSPFINAVLGNILKKINE